jgi:hypothetical protein
MKRRAAKTVFWISGHLSRIRTMQKMYGHDEDWQWMPAGEMKLPCVLSVRLLEFSMQLDWDHWDHWATDNGGIIRCECGGTR